MELLVLGTAGDRGWPEAGCPCASCAAAASHPRRPSAVVVDDGLLLCSGVDAAAAVPVPRVPWVALTHLRPGAVAGTAELLREWSRQAPVDLVGPPAALAAYRDRLPHDDRVRLVALSPGDAVPRGGQVLTAVATDDPDALAYAVTGLDGRRLLYAPAGAVPPPGPAYETVLLGSGDGLAQRLAGLRGSGAVGTETAVVAIGLHHEGLRPDELGLRLAAWGVRQVADGAVLPMAHGTAAAGQPRRTLVLGGVSSGKSALAEQLLAAQPAVTYVATGGDRGSDPEWTARVAAHRGRRPATWRTVETTDVAACLGVSGPPLLVDCLGTWLTARLDQRGVWEGAPVEAVEPDLDALVAAWRVVAAPTVVVSNEVGSGVVPATASGRLFRDLLGRLNARMAAESDVVLLVVAGIAVPLRGPSLS
jgi:adenosylcobinamide kinase/adenosylcobinamide-phosphate guanylyltransferase